MKIVLDGNLLTNRQISKVIAIVRDYNHKNVMAIKKKTDKKFSNSLGN